MLVTIDQDIFDNPVLDIRYKIGDPVNAISNFPIVLKIDEEYTSGDFPGKWRLYPEMDLSKNDWTNVEIDLSPLIESWEAAKGTDHGNIQELTIFFGNNKGPFVASEAQYSAEIIEQRTKERLDAWAEAFGKNVRKLMYVGHGTNSYVTYAGQLGMGSRQGFIEMYNYTVDAPQFGFTVNEETRYSEVDESNPFIANNPAFGDENEEYTSESKFGWKESFPYRYYVASFRMLQQRRNYVMHAPKTLSKKKYRYFLCV